MVNTNKIKAKMKELELTQNDVACSLGIRQSTANQKINNVRCFSLEEAEKLSDRIGIMSNGVLKRVGTASQLKAMEKVETFEEAFIKIATDEVLYENN